MAEFLSDLLASAVPGFFSGFQAANEYRRQKALAEFGMKMKQEEMALRRATEERMAAEHIERSRLTRETERRRMAAEQMKSFLQPAAALAAKHPEVADQLLPVAQAADQLPEAPETTPAGAGVIAPDQNPPPFGKDALREARDRSITEAAQAVRAQRESEREEDRQFKRDTLNEQIRARREAATLALADRAARAADTAAAKAAVLRPQETKELDTFGDALSLARTIKAGKEGIDTGPFAALRNSWASRLGVDDPQTSAFYASARDELATYIRSISGMATTDKERAFLSTIVPSPKDADSVFVSKLDRFIAKSQEMKDRRLRTLRAQGRDVSPYLDAAESEPGQPGAPAPDDGAVVVVTPDGKRKRLPRPAAEAIVKALPGARIE